MLTNLIIILVCLVLSGYFSATETAFSTASRPRLRALADAGNKRAAMAEELTGVYDKMLSTILVGNNIVNILLSSIATVMCIHMAGEGAGPTLATVISTIVVLIFGEITPKSIAKEKPEAFAMFSAPFLKALMWLLTPVNALFSAWKKLLQKTLHLESAQGMSSSELQMLVEEAQEQGGIDSDEGELLSNAITFTEREASQVMTHRLELTAVPVTATHREIAAAFQESRFSRLPVYRGSIDNIVGLIHQKDFFTTEGITAKPLKELMSAPVFVGPTEPVSDLLRKLQKHKAHLAVVLDEFGGSYGIVTMEDILEELVGEILDEHDEEEASVVEQDGGWLMDCDLRPDELFGYFDIDFESDVPTVAGWLMEELGRIPVVGDKLEAEDLIIRVAEVDTHRASKVFVKKRPPVL